MSVYLMQIHSAVLIITHVVHHLAFDRDHPLNKGLAFVPLRFSRCPLVAAAINQACQPPPSHANDNIYICIINKLQDNTARKQSV